MNGAASSLTIGGLCGCTIAPEESLMRSMQMGIGAGLVVMLLGAADPLEGAPLVVGGAAIATAVAAVAHDRRARRLFVAMLLLVIGVAALFAWSNVGGFGGDTGRSVWWALTITPYPVGALVAVASAVQILRSRRPLLPLTPLR